MYSTPQPLAERQKINSYLGIKYGITLSDQGYVASDWADPGTGTLWSNHINGIYKNDIAGIARDDTSGLMQLKSKSINSDALITMEIAGIGTDKAALTWGNDNGVTTYSATGAPAGKQILGRIWQVQETGAVGSVTFTTSDAGAQ